MPKPRRAATPLNELRQAEADYSLDSSYSGLSEDILKGMVEQQAGTASLAAPTPNEDPRTKDTWTFDFDWTDARGKRYNGKFTNRILNLGLLQKVAVAQSAMQQGQPLESFSPAMLVINNAIAHMAFSLTTRPNWAKDLMALDSVELAMQLWEKVRSHDDFYFRPSAAAEESD